MILQALVDYYEKQAEKGVISKPGWAKVPVSFALEIDENGQLLQVIPLKSDMGDGKKPRPREMLLPAPVKRTVRITANFLCDNAAYLLGYDGEGNSGRAKRCFIEAKNLHLALLGGAQDDFAWAICRYFETWDTDKAGEHPEVLKYMEDIKKGANLVFMFDGKFPGENKAIARAWQDYYDSSDEGEVRMRCLVTGESVVPESVHPAIKGVQGAQSSGAALVSFNAPAFCSYGREQNLNAPVGKYAAFAYTTALNHLLSDRKHVKRIGDTTVVYWAEDAESRYQDAFTCILDGSADENTVTNKDLDDFMTAISRGQPANWDGIPLKPDNRFFVLGLAPNAARLSVRFFLRDNFGSFVRNLKRHYSDIEIVRDNRGWPGRIPLWALLRETVNEKSSDKTPSPQMSGDTLRAILSGGRYPATLYQYTQLRIRAEKRISQGRAAIIKAYLHRNTDKKEYKEALTVELNDKTTYQPYVLGRLFSVAEAIQEAASDVTTIKDKYFSSACANPALVFPIVIDLMEKHLKKLEGPARIYFEKQVGELMGKITQSYPTHHNLYEQGVFQIGYYHQTQKRYEKKDKTGIVQKEAANE